MSLEKGNIKFVSDALLAMKIWGLMLLNGLKKENKKKLKRGG